MEPGLIPFPQESQLVLLKLPPTSIPSPLNTPCLQLCPTLPSPGQSVLYDTADVSTPTCQILLGP